MACQKITESEAATAEATARYASLYEAMARVSLIELNKAVYKAASVTHVGQGH